MQRANNISTKVERNVLDVSYQVTQYQTVVNELRAEISRYVNDIKVVLTRKGKSVNSRLIEQSNHEFHYTETSDRNVSGIHFIIIIIS